MSPDVLVTGARGKTGREVVAQLLQVPGAAVRAGASGTLEGPPREGSRPVRFDWRDQATWPEAVAGADAVYLMRPDVPDAPELVASLVELAAGAHVVLLSEQGAETLEPSDWVRRVEDAVVKGAARWTLLRPSWFQQNLADPRFHLESIRDAGVMELPSGGAGIAWVDARDIAAVAVAALLAPGDHDGRAHTVTGPAAVTTTAVAEALSEVTGRPVRAVDPPVADVVAGLDSWLTIVLCGIYARVRDGVVGHVSPAVETITGQRPRTVEQFVAEHADHWRG